VIDEQTVNEMLLASEMIGFEKGRDAGRKAGLEEAAVIAVDHLIYANRENPEWAQRIIAEAIRRRASEVKE
jgi:hypothetical protein